MLPLVLRIHLILMRIRILDQHWKKTDPDPGHLFKIYWIFLTKQNFQICCLTFFAYFYAKTWWTIQKSGNFYNLSFYYLFWFWEKTFFCSFWLIFCLLDPDPWIRIFVRIRFQESKIFRIRRIQILSTIFLHWIYDAKKALFFSLLFSFTF